ncbi:chromate transporter, partial [Planktomarina temperata]|nr:chromate transporter [Planktomarina temperata]
MQNQATSQVSLTQFTSVAAKIGLLSFGGPAAQIALMQDEVVDKRGWVSQQDFLRALSFCMLLPGPEAMQLATYLGWRLHGLRGGFIGGTLFILPGACVIFALAWAY